MQRKFYFVWDYDLTNNEFIEILEGRLEKGRLNQDWALIRLLEHGKYDDIIRLLGYKNLVFYWPSVRERIRIEERKRGFDFLVNWLPKNHPELLAA